MTDHPPDPTLLHRWERARRYAAGGEYVAARAELEALLVRAPGHVQAHVLLATVDLAEGRLRAACARLHLAAGALIDDPDAIATVAYCLHQVGECVAMRDCLDRPGVAQVRSGAGLLQLARMEHLLGRHARALALLERARQCGLDTADFRYQYGLALEFNGRLDDARRELEAALVGDPAHGRAVEALARLRRATPQSNHLELIDAALRRSDLDAENRAAVEFARFRELDDLDRRGEAWTALERANAIMRARLHYDPAAAQRQFETLTRIGTAGFVSADAPAQTDGPWPIFIVGLPRSGTTLLERILGNHPQIASCGELSDFPRQLRFMADVHGTEVVDDALLERMPGLDFAGLGRRYLEQTRWRAAGRSFYVDKLPDNFLLAGCIHRALPRARIVHIAREPMDVCFSNWKAFVGGNHAYAYALAALAEYHRGYARLMAHWHAVMPGAILDVAYADLVREPEGAAGKVFAFCGLPPAPGCSDLTRNASAVATLSAPDVRAGIHQRALGEWRRYAERMEPVRVALAAGSDP